MTSLCAVKEKEVGGYGFRRGGEKKKSWRKIIKR